MTDSPQHIKELQLAIWLKKTPGERLNQLLIDNEAIFMFWKNAKQKSENSHNSKPKIN